MSDPDASAIPPPAEGTPTPAVSDALVRSRDIAALSRVTGRDFSLVTPRLGADGAVLRGRYVLAPLRSGLVLHATDAADLHDTTTRVVHGAGLTVSLFLAGEADVCIGGRPLHLGTPEGVEGALMARAEPDLFVRNGRRGMRVRKVNIFLPEGWLEQAEHDDRRHQAVLAFARDHRAVARWRPSAQMTALAEQILAPPRYGPMLSGLYAESRAMELVVGALGLLGAGTEGEALAALRPRERQRMWAVHDFLEAHLQRELSLEDIAREAGMSVNSLQRAFRAAFGTTVFDYVRRRKLELARDGLAAEGLTVAQAAYVAGYGSAANFATAFKRAFGVSPRDWRERCRRG
ncbi:AraC family transcriptional regulator [Xanthobacter sp. V4C-4]|uniref:helix-turn-helix transcriptional regulator n=1 Tax=Xanthobacter cornucopiae TaxID=3119924 RepID=UPI00372630C8